MVDDGNDSAPVAVLGGRGIIGRSIVRLLTQDRDVVVIDRTDDFVRTLAPLLHVLDALRDQPGKRFVFRYSGGTVNGNPTVLPVLETHPTEPIRSYGVLKLTAEHYLRMYRHLYDLDARVLRVANTYGPDQQAGARA